MIGSIAVPEAEAGAVKARCDELKLAAETQSLVEDSEADDDAAADEEGDDAAGDAALVDEPESDGATAVTVDLDLVTLEDCEASGWFAAM